jgi:hypothetical protein
MNIISRASLLGGTPAAGALEQAGAAKSKHFIGAVALAFLASLWAMGLATPADAALHPTMAVTPAEPRRKPREIAPPYIVEWVVPDSYRAKLNARGWLR